MNSVNQKKSKRKNDSDLERCCVCFGEENLQNINIELKDTDISILGALNYCLPDETFSEKWTPPNMCSNCIKGLCYTYTFLKQVCTAQSILKNKNRKTIKKHFDLIDRVEIQRKTIKYHNVFLRGEHLEDEITFNNDHDYQKTLNKGFRRAVTHQKPVIKIHKVVKKRRRALKREITPEKEEHGIVEDISIELVNDENVIDLNFDRENMDVDEEKLLQEKKEDEDLSENNEDEKESLNENELLEEEIDYVLRNEDGEESLNESDDEEKLFREDIKKEDVKNEREIVEDEGNHTEETEALSNENDVMFDIKDEEEADQENKVLIKVCKDLSTDDGSKKLLIIYNDENPPKELVIKRINKSQESPSGEPREMVINRINKPQETANDESKEIVIKISKPQDSLNDEPTEMVIKKISKPQESPNDEPKEVIIRRMSKPQESPHEVRTSERIHYKSRSSFYTTKPQIKDIKCNVCGLKFEKSRLYLKHMKSKHSLDKNVLCDICGKLCVNNAVLMKHKISHSDQRPFKCEVCLRNFKSLRQLNIHKKHKHQNVTEDDTNVFVCTVCSMEFTKVFELKHHLYKHTNHHPYACDICDNKFGLADNLRNYELEEDRNKPFTCDLCEQNDLVPKYTDEAYNEFFNVTKQVIESLGERFRNSQYFHGHFGQHGGIPAVNQVLIFLWYIKNKTKNYRVVAEKFNITISSLNRVIQRITTFLSGLSSEIIKWPNAEEKIELEHYFRVKSLPQVIGVIETFCIKIDKPRNNPGRYINTKGEHSIKIQMVSDHRSKILDVFIGCPGSVDDEEVLENSSLGKNLAERCGNYFLVGDGRYSLKPNLLTPYKGSRLNPVQLNFNKALENSFHIARFCFHLLTSKFPQVSHVKLKDMELIVHFVRAVCVLHNITLEDYEFNIEEGKIEDVKEECTVMSSDDIDDEDDDEDNLIRDSVAELVGN